MNKLLTLFHLNKLVLQAKSTDEAAFHIVNKTLDLVSYDQAVLLLYRGDTLKSAAVDFSGTTREEETAATAAAKAENRLRRPSSLGKSGSML